MIEKPTAPISIGIEVQSNGVIYSRLSNLQKEPYIGENVKQLYMEEGDPLISTLLPTSAVLLRRLDVKLKKEKDIEATLPFQVEPLLPYPTEEAILDYLIVEKDQEGTQLCVLAARRDSLQNHLEWCKEFPLEPEVISTVPIALTAFAHHYYPTEDSFFILHLGHQETTCVLVHKGIPQAAQACRTLLVDDYTPRLAELSRTVVSLSKLMQTDTILITGEGVNNESLVAKLEEVLKKKLVKHSLGFYAASIGAALITLDGYKEKVVNFRKGTFVYPHPWKRFKKAIALYLTLCFTLALSLYLYGKSSTNYQEDQLKQEFVTLLADTGKTYTTFEEEYRAKNGLTDEAIATPKTLSLDELDSRLSLLETQLKATPDIFPLHPDVPYVSDLLAWLSTHSVVTQNEGLSLENLSYSMVKRPEQNKKNEKYKVKVELEFSSPTPSQAREFHDALIGSNNFVDQKEEIKWSSTRGKYRTSFFLKDKTNYRTK